jgi:hypothetical protein
MKAVPLLRRDVRAEESKDSLPVPTKTPEREGESADPAGPVSYGPD